MWFINFKCKYSEIWYDNIQKSVFRLKVAMNYQVKNQNATFQF